MTVAWNVKCTGLVNFSSINTEEEGSVVRQVRGTFSRIVPLDPYVVFVTSQHLGSPAVRFPNF